MFGTTRNGVEKESTKIKVGHQMNGAKNKDGMCCIGGCGVSI